MSKPFSWKLFLILWFAAVFGVVAVLPYTLTLQSDMLQNLELPIPLPILLVLQVLQSAVLFAIVTALGLLLANRVDLGAPILEAWLNKESISEKIKSILPISIILGLIAGVLIIVLDAYVFQPLLVKDLGKRIMVMPENIKPPAWQGFLASFYGGIAEEILLRLFFYVIIGMDWIIHCQTSKWQSKHSCFMDCQYLCRDSFWCRSFTNSGSDLPSINDIGCDSNHFIEFIGWNHFRMVVSNTRN